MLLTKQIGDHLRLLLASAQMAMHDGYEFEPGQLALAKPVGPDVLIEQFIRVEVQAAVRR